MVEQKNDELNFIGSLRVCIDDPQHQTKLKRIILLAGYMVCEEGETIRIYEIKSDINGK